MSVTLYVEGGGDRDDLRTECRKAFRLFFERAGFKGRMPAVSACGSRAAAFDDFKTALGAAKSGEFVVLLVDSEASVARDPATQTAVGPWTHLQSRDGWSKPSIATDDHAHLMVQCMESWFLADVDTLSQYFGSQFKADKIKSAPQIEAVSKDSVFKQLGDATANVKMKGKYDGRSKGKHSFEIMGRLDPEKVRQACPHANRLLKLLDAKL